MDRLLDEESLRVRTNGRLTEDSSRLTESLACEVLCFGCSGCLKLGALHAPRVEMRKFFAVSLRPSSFLARRRRLAKDT